MAVFGGGVLKREACSCTSCRVYQYIITGLILSHTGKSAEKWPPKTDIHVLSDFHHFPYKQIASTWSNNHRLVWVVLYE